MRKNTLSTVVFCLAAAALAGCQDSGAYVQSKDFTAGETLLTSAAVRSINRQAYAKDPQTGRLVPAYVTCAEPSPDVAMAVAKAFSAEGALSLAGLPSNVEPKVAAAISKSRVESVAELGIRLATIQLLRDGLYRACEAYANGAITPIIYAVMVSRYDDTMVTLMASEMAAGSFKRSGASLGSTANSDGSATVDGQGGPSATGKSSAQANAQAGTQAGDSKTGDGDAAAVAHAIQEIQRKYIENINVDALEMACFSALENYYAKQEPNPNALVAFCNSDAFKKVFSDKMDLLASLKKK